MHTKQRIRYKQTQTDALGVKDVHGLKLLLKQLRSGAARTIYSTAVCVVYIPTERQKCLSLSAATKAELK